MAAEITVTAQLQFTKGNSSDVLSIAALSVTLSGSQFIHHRQSIGTAQEALVLGEVTAGGWLMIVNRDATNYVSFRAALSETNAVQLKPGEPALFRLHPDATPSLQANTAACQIEYLLLAN